MVVAALFLASIAYAEMMPIPPVAKKKLVVHEKHGVKREDPYFWMKEREKPEVIQHLKNENAYYEKVMAGSKKLEEKIFQEIKLRIKENESSAPVLDKGFYYQARYEKGKQYAVHVRRKGSMKGKEEILYDENEHAKGHEFFSLGGLSVSPNQKLMAAAVDTVGRNFHTITFKDLEKNEWLPLKIENVTGNMAWAADNETFFYTKQNPETLRSERIFRGNLKTGKSEEVYFEKDETFNVSVSATLTEKFLFISSAATLSSEVRYLDAANPTGEWKVFLPREKEHEYSVDDGGDRFFVATNWQAKNFRLMETPYSDTSKAAWKEVIPHRADVLLGSYQIFKNQIVTVETREGMEELWIRDRKDLSAYMVPMPEKAYCLGLGGATEFDSPFFRYSYQSMKAPPSVYDYDFAKKRRRLVKRHEVPGYKAEKYKSDRIWITARDGVKIPVTLLMPKAAKLNGKNPIFVYGYGSYGSSMVPEFTQSVLSLVDRGFVYAVLHVRGGQELGRQWYESGRTHKKMNTFFDFIDATEELVKLGYGSAKRVYANGGSAGGLLMGAIANLRPDLYRAIWADVPFVDVITTMLDDSIPLTTGEYDEWGNPNVKADFEYIMQYSPLDNVRKAKFPYIFATTGLHDSQVQYWEPAKWVAKLRDFNEGPNFILLKTNMDAGHGGASGRYNFYREVAQGYAFFAFIDQRVK